MNLNQLRAFHAVAKTGAFSKAAEELFVTEPAVFIQVRSLERYLGFKLFDKLGKDLMPTEVGRMLFEYADKIFGMAQEAHKAVKDLRDLKSGELRIGSSKAITHHLMPVVLSSFQDSYTTIKVLLSEGSSEELVKGILNYRFEVAIVARVPYPKGIKVTPLSKDTIVVVVSPSNYLATKKGVSLEELNGQSIICREAGSATRFLILTEFEKQGFKPSSVLESGSTEFIKDMVKKDRGYSFLGSICVQREIERGELAVVDLKGEGFTLDIDVIQLKDKTLSPAAVAFVRFLQENIDIEDLRKTANRIQLKGKSTSYDCFSGHQR